MVSGAALQPDGHPDMPRWGTSEVEGMAIVIDAEREFWAAEATLHTFTKHAVRGR